jgi:hypothetical protein
MRTYHFELLVVAAVLAAVTGLSDGEWFQYIGAGAVLLSFAHVQVADRLAAAESQRIEFATRGVRVSTSGDVAARYAHEQRMHSVSCHRWAARYLVGKEALWLVYFVTLGAWSAIAGVVMFLLYPLWRHWWRKS